MWLANQMPGNNDNSVKHDQNFIVFEQAPEK